MHRDAGALIACDDAGDLAAHIAPVIIVGRPAEPRPKPHGYTFFVFPHMDEEWKPVVGYEGWYSVSNLGRVRRDRGGSNNARPGRILKAITSSPYPFVSLHNGRQNIARVHLLVAAAFLGPRPPGMEVNHKNGDKTDNRLENLEYVTPSENIAHAVRTGLWRAAFGEAHGNAKLRESDVRLIVTELAAGARQADLVRRLGVSRDAISRIALGKAWRHISRRRSA